MLGYINALVGLQAIHQFWLPAAFRMGYLVIEASWNGRTAGGGKQVFPMLGQKLQLLVQLLGVGSVSRDSYVRTISCALLTWQPWFDELPGVSFVEESCEAMLSRFGHRLEVNLHVKTFDDTYIHIGMYFVPDFQ